MCRGPLHHSVASGTWRTTGWWSFHLNWVGLPVFLVLALVVALYARHVAGGWTRAWLGVKPAWWFVLLFVLPWIGLPVLVVGLFVHRHTPGAITGRDAAG